MDKDLKKRFDAELEALLDEAEQEFVRNYKWTPERERASAQRIVDNVHKFPCSDREKERIKAKFEAIAQGGKRPIAASKSFE